MRLFWNRGGCWYVNMSLMCWLRSCSSVSFSVFVLSFAKLFVNFSGFVHFSVKHGRPAPFTSLKKDLTQEFTFPKSIPAGKRGVWVLLGVGQGETAGIVRRGYVRALLCIQTYERM